MPPTTPRQLQQQLNRRHSGQVSPSSGLLPFGKHRQELGMCSVRETSFDCIVIIIITETAGTWHKMAIELTQEIGRRITTITEDIRETTFLFQRLSMALQRGNAVFSTTPW